MEIYVFLREKCGNLCYDYTT